MIKIRKNTFETNSSSTHAIAIPKEPNFKKQSHVDFKWEEFYQGDDGTSTMYVDLVKKEFAKTSTSENRYKLLDNIEDMFSIIKGENYGTRTKV